MQQQMESARPETLTARAEESVTPNNIVVIDGAVARRLRADAVLPDAVRLARPATSLKRATVGLFRPLQHRPCPHCLRPMVLDSCSTALPFRGGKMWICTGRTCGYSAVPEHVER
jgi:hypothetical protein